MLELFPYVLPKYLQSLSENLLIQNRCQLSADLLPLSDTQTPHILVVKSARLERGEHAAHSPDETRERQARPCSAIDECEHRLQYF